MSGLDQTPGSITEIRDQVRDPERVSLFIDGEFRMGLPRKLVEERNLSVGLFLTAEDLEELEAMNLVSRAIESGIRLLSFRPRSRSELQRRMQRKGFERATIDTAISELARLGYVDDEEFAQYWVENRQSNRPRGKRLLAAELRDKGVPKPVIEDTLEHAGIDESRDALELARGRAARLTGLDQATRERRLAGFLQRRGFNWDAVRSAIDQLKRDGDL